MTHSGGRILAVTAEVGGQVAQSLNLTHIGNRIYIQSVLVGQLEVCAGGSVEIMHTSANRTGIHVAACHADAATVVAFEMRDVAVLPAFGVECEAEEVHLVVAAVGKHLNVNPLSAAELLGSIVVKLNRVARDGYYNIVAPRGFPEVSAHSWQQEAVCENINLLIVEITACDIHCLSQVGIKERLTANQIYLLHGVATHRGELFHLPAHHLQGFKLPLCEWRKVSAALAIKVAVVSEEKLKPERHGFQIGNAPKRSFNALNNPVHAPKLVNHSLKNKILTSKGKKSAEARRVRKYRVRDLENSANVCNFVAQTDDTASYRRHRSGRLHHPWQFGLKWLKVMERLFFPLMSRAKTLAAARA